MPNIRLPLLLSASRTRVSPYPLRSNRTQNHVYEPELVDPSNWEEVKCVICMESPHNAVRLHCASSSGVCRPYMCDPTSPHSSCFKQFRKTSKRKYLDPKIMECPLCRGKIFATTKVSRYGRKCMNTKPKPCSMDACQFSGTCTQLDKHMKDAHPQQDLPNVDLLRRRKWDAMIANDENNNLFTALQNYHGSVQDYVEAWARFNNVAPPLMLNNVDQPLMLNNVDPPLMLNNVAPPLMLNNVDPPVMLNNVALPLMLNNVDQPLMLNNVDPPLMLNNVDLPLMLNNVAPPLMLNNVAPPVMLNNVAQPLMSPMPLNSSVSFSYSVVSLDL